MRIILGAGLKVTQTCDLFNINDEIAQFYEKPRYPNETKYGKPVADVIYDPTEKYVVTDMHGDCREKRNAVKKFTSEALERGIEFAFGQLHHHLALFVEPNLLGEGTIIRPYSIICSHTKLGNHVDIGNLSNIAHHCNIGDYSIIAGHVAMSGEVTLGEGVFIGQGAAIKPKITISEGSVVGTGAVVVKDVPPNTVVAGNPAKPNPKFKAVTPW